MRTYNSDSNEVRNYKTGEILYIKTKATIIDYAVSHDQYNRKFYAPVYEFYNNGEKIISIDVNKTMSPGETGIQEMIMYNPQKTEEVYKLSTQKTAATSFFVLASVFIMVIIPILIVMSVILSFMVF